MSARLDASALGPPDLQLAGLTLWVHRYPEAGAGPYEDWLTSSAHCTLHGAAVWVTGAFLRLSEIAAWGEACARLDAGDTEEAVLETIEPELQASLRRHGSLGHLILRVEMTPDHLSQGHWFEFEIDQSYLPELIRQCRTIAKGG